MSATTALSTSSPSSIGPLSPRTFVVIVAATLRGGIGLKGDLPWKRQLKSDLKHFERETTDVVDYEPPRRNAVIMGRKTWCSLPDKHRPLRNRINVIVTRQPIPTASDAGSDSFDLDLLQACQQPDTFIASSLQAALNLLSHMPLSEQVAEIFVIGGASLYSEAMRSSQCQCILLTSVLTDFECDTHIEPIDLNTFRLDHIGAVTLDDNIPHQLLTYLRCNCI